MSPKEFIKTVLIKEIDDIVKSHPYLSFALMSIGLEFLGKCMLTHINTWHKINPSKAYEKAEELMCQVDERYKKINLQDELRNGFAHTFIPKGNIALSEVKNGFQNFDLNSCNQTVLVAEEFYENFVTVCQKVVDNNFDKKNKMNKAFLRVGK